MASERGESQGKDRESLDAAFLQFQERLRDPTVYIYTTEAGIFYIDLWENDYED